MDARLPSEAALATRYAVSRTTIREAIHKLAMGLVSCGLRRNDVIALQAPNSAALMLLGGAVSVSTVSADEAKQLVTWILSLKP